MAAETFNVTFKAMPGDDVYVRNYRKKSKPLVLGTVINCEGRVSRTKEGFEIRPVYEVQVPNDLGTDKYKLVAGDDGIEVF